MSEDNKDWYEKRKDEAVLEFERFQAVKILLDRQREKLAYAEKQISDLKQQHEMLTELLRCCNEDLDSACMAAGRSIAEILRERGRV